LFVKSNDLFRSKDLQNPPEINRAVHALAEIVPAWRPSPSHSTVDMKTIRKRRKNSPRRDVGHSHSGSAVRSAEVRDGAQIWLTREQMRIRLGVSLRTIDYWTKDGTLPFLKRGGIVRFNVEDCDAVLRKFYQRSRLA
jgi:excisionase family DNA binding protein